MVSQLMALDAGRLQFSDAESCRKWLEALPLTNVSAAQQRLLQQIALLNQSAIAPGDLLSTLETLREAVLFVQGELAAKFSGKAQPLDANESGIWARVQSLWQEYADAYLICRDAHAKGDLRLLTSGALIVARAMRCIGAAMFDHYRVYRQVPAELWKKLNQLYVFAEQSGFARTKIAAGARDSGSESSCSAVYCQALLAHLANPFAMSARQMDFLAAWTEKWSLLTNLSANALPPSEIGRAHV